VDEAGEAKFLIGWRFGTDENGQQDFGAIDEFFVKQFVVPMEVWGFTDTENTLTLDTKEAVLDWAKRYFDYYTTETTPVDLSKPII